MNNLVYLNENVSKSLPLCALNILNSPSKCIGLLKANGPFSALDGQVARCSQKRDIDRAQHGFQWVLLTDHVNH